MSLLANGRFKVNTALLILLRCVVSIGIALLSAKLVHACGGLTDAKS